MCIFWNVAAFRIYILLTYRDVIIAEKGPDASGDEVVSKTEDSTTSTVVRIRPDCDSEPVRKLRTLTRHTLCFMHTFMCTYVPVHLVSMKNIAHDEYTIVVLCPACHAFWQEMVW